MDLSKLIREKCQYFDDTDFSVGIECVMNHIDIAERHLKSGQQGDDYLFNDVIYRSNQAFEGALKEAYAVLTGESSNRKTPNDIEKYLESNNLLNERVLELFSNYRREWRNKSTHDYKLYFSQQEAFLGIVSIYAFFNILLDQMIEKHAKDKEQLEAQKFAEKLKEKSNIGFYEFVEFLLTSYFKEVGKVERSNIGSIEAELLGSLHGFLNAIAPEINVSTDTVIKMGRRTFRPDLILERDGSKVIIELKSPVMDRMQSIIHAKSQLYTYMSAANIDHGILFIPPFHENQKMCVDKSSKDVAGVEHKVTGIYAL